MIVVSVRRALAVSAALSGTAAFCADAVAAWAPTTWADGEMVTYSQGNWGNEGSAGGELLAERYFDVYAVNGILEAGIPGVAGNSIRFTAPDPVQAFLPSGGVEGSLTADHVDPSPPTEAGRFAADVIALILNVEFSAAGYLRGTRDVAFGELVMHGVAGIPDGTSVAEFLSLSEGTLGGAFTGYTPAQLTPIVVDLNFSFNVGGVTDFARDHLALVPEPASLALLPLGGLLLTRRR